MSQQQKIAQTVLDSQDHDSLPEAMLSDNLVRDEALRLMVRLGLAAAPDAQHMAANMGESPRGRGDGRGRGRSRGRGQFRGRVASGVQPSAAPQRSRSVVEELSTVSASQTQIKDLVAEVADLSRMNQANTEAIAGLVKRVDSMSERQRKDNANIRQSLNSLATDFTDMKNLVSYLCTRSEGVGRATYPSMTAGDLAQLTLASGVKVTGEEKVSLRGSGVPSKAIKIVSQTSKDDLGTTASQTDTTQVGLQKGILVPKSAAKGKDPAGRPVMAVHSPAPARVPAPVRYTATAATVRQGSKDSGQGVTRDPQSSKGIDVERLGPTAFRQQLRVSEDEDLIDFQETWDEQMSSLDAVAEENYNDDDYEEDEDLEYLEPVTQLTV